MNQKEKENVRSFAKFVGTFLVVLAFAVWFGIER